MARKKSLLGGLFKPKKKSPLKVLITPAKKQRTIKKPSKPSMIRIVGSESVALEIPEGPREGRIYTYDGRPLKGTRKGSVFRMNIVRGSVEMKSIYTGTSWYDDENSCVAYDGFAVGYLSGGAYYVSQAVEKYGTVSIAVRRDGTDPGGWPLLTALIPENYWFKDLLGISTVKKECNTSAVEAWIPEGAWKIKAQNDSYTLTVRIIPTPKGSSAKPHLDVLLDGISCAEVSAKYGCYNSLVSLADMGPCECTLSNHMYDDGTSRRKLEIRVREP